MTFRSASLVGTREKPNKRWPVDSNLAEKSTVTYNPTRFSSKQRRRRVTPLIFQLISQSLYPTPG